MNQNLQNTKKKLSIVFTLIVFFAILIIWLGFFSLKYAELLRQEKRWFWNLVQQLKNQPNALERFINQSYASINRWPWSRWEPRIQNARGFTNFIVLQDQEIIASNVQEELDEPLLNYLLNDISERRLLQKNGYLIERVENQELSIIVFKKLRYDFHDFLSELSWFLVLNIFFSLLVFFIGRKFIEKVFIPVEENMQDMKDFVHHTWHEFKTPLAVIDSNVQMLHEMKQYEPEMLTEIQNETYKLWSIISTLINLQDLKQNSEITHIYLWELSKSILKSYQSQIDQKKLRVTNDVENTFSVRANQHHMYIFLSNVIWNAIKYSCESWNISLDFDWRIFSVIDTWIGIEKEKIWKVFNRFYKTDSSRNTEGFWIGLSLVKKIADINGWKILIESELWKWTRFIVEF